jgi:hypothetical protein
MFMIDWLNCPIKYDNICFTIQLHTNNSNFLPAIVLKDIKHNKSLNLSEGVLMKLQEFEDFSTFVILSMCLSSFLSYLIFIIGLLKLYIKPFLIQIKCCKKYIIEELDKKVSKYCNDIDDTDQENPTPATPTVKIPHPFNDDEPKVTIQMNQIDNDTSTRLELKETCYFITFLFFNIAIFISMLGIFVHEQYTGAPQAMNSDGDGKNETSVKEQWEQSAIGIYLWSHFSSIISCFIFAKLTYGLEHKCNNIMKYVKDANDNYNQHQINQYFENHIQNELVPALKEKKLQIYLKSRYQDFANVAKNTLQIFQVWFLVHWVFYVITCFMTVGLFIESVLMTLRDRQSHLKDGIPFQDWEWIFLALLSASNLLMFIYPCLRAAAITQASKRLINRITKESYKFKNLPDGLLEDFVSYLEKRKYTFRLSVCCCSIPFSLNIAYISICIGLFGIVAGIIATLNI